MFCKWKQKLCHLYFQRSSICQRKWFFKVSRKANLCDDSPPPSFCLPADVILLLLLLISVFAEHFEGHGEKSVRDRGVGMRKGGVSSGSSFFLRFRWSVNLEVLSREPQMTGAVFKSLMPLTRTGYTLWAAAFASQWDCWTMDQWCDSVCLDKADQ